MRMAIRANILKTAIEDDETRRKLNLALTWDECTTILAEFTKKRGFKVVQL